MMSSNNSNRREWKKVVKEIQAKVMLVSVI